MAKMNRKIRVSKLARVNVSKKVRFVPMLRLTGDWLAAAGFCAGGVVEIELLEGGLVVRLVA